MKISPHHGQAENRKRKGPSEEGGIRNGIAVVTIGVESKHWAFKQGPEE